MTKALVLVTIVVCLLSITASAQEVTGNLSGRIKDSTQATIPGVVVTLKSPVFHLN